MCIHRCVFSIDGEIWKKGHKQINVHHAFQLHWYDLYAVIISQAHIHTNAHTVRAIVIKIKDETDKRQQQNYKHQIKKQMNWEGLENLWHAHAQKVKQKFLKCWFKEREKDHFCVYDGRFLFWPSRKKVLFQTRKRDRTAYIQK